MSRADAFPVALPQGADRKTGGGYRGEVFMPPRGPAAFSGHAQVEAEGTIEFRSRAGQRGTGVALQADAPERVGSRQPGPHPLPGDVAGKVAANG